MQAPQPRRRPFRLVNLVAAVLIVTFGCALSGVDQDGSLVPVAAVATGRPGPDGVEHTLAIDGTARTFRAYTPAGSTARLPLVVVLHGRGQSQQQAVTRTGFLGFVEQRRAVVVFADGIGRSWNAGHGCCGIAGLRGEPDAAFITALVAESERAFPVDPSRVYLVGYSNGGKLAYGLGCAHPQLFAAIATYGAVPLDACPAGAPLPMLISYGGADTVLPAVPATDVALQRLLTRDRCTGTPPGTQIGAATVRHWTACAADVESIVYPELGHAWPAAGVVGKNAAGAALMWAFLFNHHR